MLKTAFNKALKTKILVDGSGPTLYLLTSEAHARLPEGLAGLWYVVSAKGEPIKK